MALLHLLVGDYARFWTMSKEQGTMSNDKEQ
jgi:hypothetical protein